LHVAGLPAKVFVAMRYWHPFIPETVKEIVAQGFQRVVVLPLFPQYSQATTGSCLAQVNKALQKYKDKVEVYIIKKWPKQPQYIESLVNKIKAALAVFPSEQRDKVEVVFTAHSLPADFVNQGDPYVKQIEETVAACLKLLKVNNWHIAFQSRSGPVKWLEPATDKLISKLAQKGSKYLLFVPISFVSDHIETLYEIDIMFKEQAVKEGFIQVERCAALNSDELFIKGLAALVKEKLAAVKKEEVHQ
jgi:ferrochelatase